MTDQDISEAKRLSELIINDEISYETWIKPKISMLAKRIVADIYRKETSLKAWESLVRDLCKTTGFYKRVLHDWQPTIPIQNLAAKPLQDKYENDIHIEADRLLALKQSGKPWSFRSERKMARKAERARLDQK